MRNIVIIIIAHNIRSIHNVGSIFRTCEGFGVQKLYLSGYTPYPPVSDDERPPHVRATLARALHKTALGTEKLVPYEHRVDPESIIETYRQKGYEIVALEQHARSVSLANYKSPEQLVLLLGEEVAGVEPRLLSRCDTILEIPMSGRKESFNVSVAAGIALYALTTA